MKLQFVGAAKIVTGSCYWIRVGRKQFLVDCGMFQGRKQTTALNYKPFPFDPKKIDFVFLTHAHIDHSGLIPKLKKEGFKGKIYTTKATADLCKIMLEDSGHVHEMENEHENRRRQREGQPLRVPLYTVRDARDCFSSFKGVDYDVCVKADKNIQVIFKDAGHIMGSAILEVFIKEGNEDKKLVFSGDLGQWDVPIVRDPTLIEDADYVFVESTYGDRLHEDVVNRNDKLLEIAKETFERGGKLFIPSFAIERTQEILYAMKKMIKKGVFPKEKVFLNSPLAIKATEIFRKHTEVYDKEALAQHGDVFKFPALTYTLSTQESIKLNQYQGPCIIIARSGMLTGGRMKHHLKNGLWDEKNTLLFVGYQAKGTLGRIILEGAKKVRMLGATVAVNASIKKINGFSAHADYKDLIRWMKGFVKKPRKVFVIHGEAKSSLALKTKLDKMGFKCQVPNLRQEVNI